MKENLMNSAHKTSTKEYRMGWDRIFGNKREHRSCYNCWYLHLCLNYSEVGSDAWKMWSECDLEHSNWEARD